MSLGVGRSGRVPRPIGRVDVGLERDGTDDPAPSCGLRADPRRAAPYRVAVARPHLPPPPLLDPGWYPDPTGRYEARYWDGRKWSSHISHYGATGADPLLRARFDHWWLRLAGRVVVWVAIAGLVWWAVDRWWPTDDRDLEADRQIAESAVLPILVVPVGWTPVGLETLSPLDREVAEDGTVQPATCEPLADVIGDGADEPRGRAAYAAPDGVQSMASEVVVWGGSGAAGDHLDALRLDEAGPCLADLLVESAGRSGQTLEVTSVEAQIDPRYGDEALWWRLRGEVVGGLPVELTTDLLVVRTGRAVTTYRFSSSVGEIAVDVQRDIVSRSAALLGEQLTAADAEDDPADETPSPDSTPATGDGGVDPATEPAGEGTGDGDGGDVVEGGEG